MVLGLVLVCAVVALSALLGVACGGAPAQAPHPTTFEPVPAGKLVPSALAESYHGKGVETELKMGALMGGTKWGVPSAYQTEQYLGAMVFAGTGSCPLVVAKTSPCADAVASASSGQKFKVWALAEPSEAWPACATVLIADRCELGATQTQPAAATSAQ